MLEPGAPLPTERMQNIADCSTYIPRPRIIWRADPLIPGVTDTTLLLSQLCECAKILGVDHVAASYMYASKKILAHMCGRDSPLPSDIKATIRNSFSTPLHPMNALAANKMFTNFEHRYLKYAFMCKIFADDREKAIGFSICGCSNPEYSTEKCGSFHDIEDL